MNKKIQFLNILKILGKIKKYIQAVSISIVMNSNTNSVYVRYDLLSNNKAVKCLEVKHL